MRKKVSWKIVKWLASQFKKQFACAKSWCGVYFAACEFMRRKGERISESMNSGWKKRMHWTWVAANIDTDALCKWLILPSSNVIDDSGTRYISRMKIDYNGLAINPFITWCKRVPIIYWHERYSYRTFTALLNDFSATLWINKHQDVSSTQRTIKQKHETKI